MINNKRTQIRKDIRRGELHNFFTLKRKEIIEGKVTVFKELDMAISADYPKMNDMELTSALLTCLHSYPDEENTYIVIGNYLFSNNSRINYFFTPLVDTPRYLENQMWCFKIIASILEQQHRQDE